MLRPSDVAPNSLFVDEDGIENKFIFSRNQIAFTDSGNLAITIHGNKNDTTRTGFTVEIPRANNTRICPVESLSAYLQRTSHLVSAEGPVFISLRAPYGPLSSQGIRNILNDAIDAVGLPRDKYSAKCFRPTGATRAVELGFEPNIVQKLGRWKTASVFFEHYVHANVPKNFTDKMFS